MRQSQCHRRAGNSSAGEQWRKGSIDEASVKHMADRCGFSPFKQIDQRSIDLWRHVVYSEHRKALCEVCCLSLAAADDGRPTSSQSSTWWSATGMLRRVSSTSARSSRVVTNPGRSETCET